jgi:hypothetical protein
MAHYAFLDENNIVTEVIPGKDENAGGINWEQYYGNIRGQVCKRTSYNTQKGIHYLINNNGERTVNPDQSKAFRKNFAGIGLTYNYDLDAFICPKPYNSWILNETTCDWECPIPYPETYIQGHINPETGNSEKDYYVWDENTVSWVLTPRP